MRTVKGRGRADAPFVYQTLDALDAIEEQFEGRALATAIALYVGLTRLANDLGGGTPTFRAEQREVARRSGCSSRTVREYAPKLEAAGVLKVERADGDVCGWRLVEPRQLPPGGAAAPAGGTPAAAAGGSGSSRRGQIYIEEREEKSASGSAREATFDGVDAPDEMVREALLLLQRKERVGSRIVAVRDMRAAVAMLAEFNRRGGRRFGIGPNLAQPVERARERPSWEVGQFVEVVAWQFAHPWWKDELQLGFVFGPKAFERAYQQMASGADGSSRKRFVRPGHDHRVNEHA